MTSTRQESVTLIGTLIQSNSIKSIVVVRQYSLLYFCWKNLWCAHLYDASRGPLVWGHQALLLLRTRTVTIKGNNQSDKQILAKLESGHVTTRVKCKLYAFNDCNRLRLHIHEFSLRIISTPVLGSTNNLHAHRLTTSNPFTLATLSTP